MPGGRTQVMPGPHPVAAGLTVRAVALGMILSVLVTLWTIHSAYVIHASFITIAHLPIAALCPLVLVVLVLNPALKIVVPDRSLSRPEIIVIFFLVFTASAIPGWAFSTYALSVISGPHYFASAENRWAELFFDYLPAWLVVSDRGGAVTWFFESLPRGQTVPWRYWVIPLFWWGSFYAAIFFVGASLMVILRKQWIEHERLTFPLAQVPLMLIEGSEERAIMPRIARTRSFWVGFGATLAIMAWNTGGYFTSWPTIPLGNPSTVNLELGEAWSPVMIRFNYLLMGIAYFTRTEILFSVWFFYLVQLIEQGVMGRMGVANARGVMELQHFAGFLVFSLFTVWMARRHLYRVWRKCLGGAKDLDDSREFFSYRTAVFGLIAGTVFMVGWLQASGMSLWLTCLFLLFLIVVYLGVTRIVAETGLAALDLPHNDVNTATVRLVGTEGLSSRDLTVLSLANAYGRNWRTLGMCSMAHAAKVGDRIGGVGKGVYLAIAATLVLTFLTSIVYTLHLAYSGGAFEFTEPAFVAGARGVWDGLEMWIRNAQVLSPSERVSFGAGALVSLLLILAHHRLPWWPLHPVGFAVAMIGGVRKSVVAILLVWLVKVIILRVGDESLYRRGQPLVIGVIAAYAVGVLLSYIVDVIWFPGDGHAIHGW
ncbi:MAG: hypothetical protein OXD39_01585 [Gemmatimonadetes bacterium]|nr:hypothetical protein [Gemmatimonadota bacterium]